ncbi:MAG: hypothetical protein ABFQ95_00340 [Pseudomonadota bacterium]
MKLTQQLVVLILATLSSFPTEATVFLGKALDFTDKDDFSLLFTPEEQYQIKSTNRRAHIRAKTPIHQAKQLHLNAVLYVDENNWTIWINGHKITPNSPNVHLIIHKVSSEHILCTWKHTTQNYEVELRTNQMFKVNAVHQ